MEVIDAKYRDRRKLIFYFTAEKRIDFRELVRELFSYATVAFTVVAVVHARSPSHLQG
ncbi:hypothetical protein EDC04DRAFT_2699731 [Pisolithus marmoratus]|nr:hypothetical protein EDC04DRAFT_2699731 [Pisolithus marmoratus]